MTAQLPDDAAPGSESTAGSADTDTRRPLRADARHNSERLVLAAREVFSVQGAGAPMEAIAKLAGVGVGVGVGVGTGAGAGAGTLYRYLPNRIDVFKAVLRTV